MIVAAASCPHASRCGGCDRIDLPYPAQLEDMAGRLRAALAPYPELAAVALGPVRAADPVVGYRTRIKWMAGPGGALGLFARGSHDVVDIPGCLVAAPGLAGLAEALRGMLREPRFARVTAALRAIDLREVVAPSGALGALVTLVLVREERPPRRDLVAMAEALRTTRPEVAGVSANWAAKHAIQVLGDETELLAGEDEVLDVQGDVQTMARTGSFIQAHRGQAAAMARELTSRVTDLRAGNAGAPIRVLELFAGASPFGLALARAGCDVTSVESFAPSVEGAQRAAAAQGLSLQAIVDDAERAALRLSREGARFDVVIVDPPRRGLSPPLRRSLAALAPRAIGYVSCDPETLARDLAHLSRLGLAPTAVEPWDFVPLTSHVEALAWLEPGPVPEVRELTRRGGTVVVEAPAHFTRKAAGGWPRGATGAMPVELGQAELGRARLLVAVRGPLGPRLPGLRGTLQIQRRSPARSLIAIELADAVDLGKVDDLLARAGHPVLGDVHDRATARHLFEKLGVDRPLVHVERIEIGGEAVSCPLAPDLVEALRRLGLGGT